MDKGLRGKNMQNGLEYPFAANFLEGSGLPREVSEALVGYHASPRNSCLWAGHPPTGYTPPPVPFPGWTLTPSAARHTMLALQ